MKENSVNETVNGRIIYFADSFNNSAWWELEKQIDQDLNDILTLDLYTPFRAGLEQLEIFSTINITND